MPAIPQRLLGEALIISEKKASSKTAIVVKSTTYTYAELMVNAEKLAHYLTYKGIRKGDRVAVYMNNSWHAVISIYGITLAGAVFLVINPQTKYDKLNYILNDSGSKILITEGILKNELNKLSDSSSCLSEIIIAGSTDLVSRNSNLHIESLDQILADKIQHSVIQEIIPNDLAALIYTSGSTGFPKGVMMTHQSMVFTTWSLIQYLRLSEDDRILLLLPLAFDYGLYQLLMAITLGASLVVEKSFAFQTSVYRQIEESRATVFPGVPTIFAMMIEAGKKHPLIFKGITRVTNTAAALPKEFLPELKKIFPNALIFKMYGLTECKRVCYLEPELIDQKPDSVGKAIPGTEVFLLSQDGSPVAPGEKGILHIRGPHVMLGYWNKPELSNEMLIPGNLPGEKILCSKDWFRMDDDGCLYFLGRTDDIIKTRGEKVSPVEIENVIYKIPGIKEVIIMGIPDQILGEAIIAFITVYQNITLGEEDIKQACTSKMELFMVPEHVILLSEMPKSQNGKIDKNELMKEFYKNGNN